MRATWSALYLQLVNSCNRRSSEIAYGHMRLRQPVFSAATCIADLVHRQHAPGGDPTQRNAVLQALIAEVQAPEPAAELAATILILALWPGLDAVHCRLCRDFPRDRPDHGGQILSRVAIGIQQLDLQAVGRIAATLVMNAERDIRRDIVGSKNRGKSEVSMDSPSGTAALAVAVPDEPPISIKEWRKRLTAILGRDADLFLRIIVLGETQHEAGAALGLTHDAARKRRQRGMAKLRAAANNPPDLSHSVARIGFYPAETREAGQ